MRYKDTSPSFLLTCPVLWPGTRNSDSTSSLRLEVSGKPGWDRRGSMIPQWGLLEASQFCLRKRGNWETWKEHKVRVTWPGFEICHCHAVHRQAIMSPLWSCLCLPGMGKLTWGSQGPSHSHVGCIEGEVICINANVVGTETWFSMMDFK